MAKNTKNDGWSKAPWFAMLRREILAARLNVTLGRLGHKASMTVMQLAKMKLPRICRPNYHDGDVHAEVVARRASEIRAGRRPTVPAQEVRSELGLEG